MSRPFVHLHCHSHFSLLDGAGSIDRLVTRAASHGMNALAITDHGNLHGAVEFYRKCKEAGLNPIIGYEAYIAPGSRLHKEASSMKEASFHLTLLATNRTGFRNLVKMASAASLEGFYFKPRIDKELLQEHNEGIVCLSGCVSSEFNQAILRSSGAGVPPAKSAAGETPAPLESHLEQAMETARWFRKLLGERYFLEIMNNGAEVQKIALEGTVEISKKLGIPLVATSDCHYVDREDAEAQDVMLCINTGKFRTDPGRLKMDGNQYYLRSPDDMYAAFPGLEDAVARSQEIADGVDIDLELGKRHFPSFTLPESKTADELLRELCEQGLKERYAGDDEMLPSGEFSQVVRDRLDRELSVISKLGFSNYFLICWDFVRYARERDIPATARGSGVGAIVCYALYLSHVCPIKYDLLFERFLDENRKEAPDIDIDFCKDRRADVMQYVKDKYGEENVAQIGTFGTLAARAAIRDVGRALGIPLARVNQIVAMVPEVLNIKLAKALETSEDLKKTYDGDGEIREVIDLALKIEGLARNVGTHAAAVVIADRPLTEYVPLGRVSGKTDIITQWSMNDVEAAGLLKMDFLGLRNLTILSKTVELIEQTTGEKVDPYKFPLDDKETFALLQRGETKGIFQLESGGIRDLLQKMKPDHFRDIIATNALYRPGPLEGGMVDEYVNVKNGRKEAEYKHPVLEEILGETHGVMVYQEQVMRIINRLGGVPLANAYTCIKAISKKKESIIAENEKAYLTGAVSNGFAKKDAVELWEMILKFAGYGFNKCVIGATEIIDAQSGSRTTVRELFDQRRPFMVHSLGDDFQLRPKAVTDVVYNGRKRVFRLQTVLGKSITATGNHPFRVLDGWKRLDELRPGHRIAAPRHMKITTNEHWPRHELIVLAGLLSEGNTCHPSCLYFYNDCRELIDDFTAAAEQFPRTVARVDHRADGRRMEVCLSTGQDTRFQPGQTPWNAGGASVATKTERIRSGAFEWAERLELLGKAAAQKRVPAVCFGLCDEDLELFLGRMWAGDGFVGATGQMPFYATSSRALADDVQALLLRLGIVGRVHAKAFRYKYKGIVSVRDGYTVHLIGTDSIAEFVRRVLPHALGRQTQAATYRVYPTKQEPSRSSKDTIGAEVRSWVNDERSRAGLTWRELERRSGVSVRELCRKNECGKRGFRRETIRRLADFFGASRLQTIADSDLFWDTVAAIEPAGTADTYDLTIADDHNFVANGIVVHNSHSTAYALIAYMTAYLKAHYPQQFMAALLSGDIAGRNFKRKDQLVEHMEDCQRMEIEVVPPNVNSSGSDFTVTDGKIHFALSAIKGCGGGAADAIVAARTSDGPFRDIFDFCERVDSASCNRSTIETLIKAGAMDGLGGHRAQLLAAIDRAMQSGAAAAADRRSGQMSLFGGEEQSPAAQAAGQALPDVAPLEDREKLLMEREVLGFYLTSHPLAEHQETLATFCQHTTNSLEGLPDRAEVVLGGMLSSLKFSHTKNARPGKPTKYVMFDLEDAEGVIRCILWPDDFEKYAELVQPDAILLARGALDRRGGDEANLIVNELVPLDQLDSRFTKGVLIRLDGPHSREETLHTLREILRAYPGQCDLQLLLSLDDGQRVKMRCDGLRVDVQREMRQRVDDLLGPGNLKLLTNTSESASA